jgi:curved DNA-binding protein CbpA
MNLKDQRLFRRYTRDTDIVLKFRKKYFKAKMNNYSPDGIGAVIENKAPIGKGDVVEIIADDPEIKTFGEVVWSMIERSTLSVGVKNVGRMDGATNDYRLADILIGLQRGLKTGVLTIASGNTVKKIYIRNGDMIFSASNHEEDRLGDILFKAGRINTDQYAQSVTEMQRTGQRQGAALVRLGYLDPKELISSVQNQVEQIIESTFALENSRFEFREMPLPTEEVITLRLSAANLIYRGIKNIGGINRIRKEMPEVSRVLDFSADPLDLFQDLRLDEPGLQIISRIDGNTSIKDIISLTQLDSLDALKTIYALLSVRTVELKEEGAVPGEIPEDVVDEILEEKSETTIAHITQEMIEDMLQKCEHLGHYGVLGVKDHAPVSEIKAAYYRAAKKYHPDMHFALANDSIKNKLSDIFSCVYEAYATLSDPQKRSEYDKIKTVKGAKITVAPDRARAAFEEGKNHLKKNNFEDAERLFGQAAYWGAATAEHHYYHGLTLTRLNKLKEAIEAFESARRLEPQNADYLSELGFAYLLLGFPERAKRLFHRSLSISPDNSRAVEGLKEIKGFYSQ